MDANVQRSKEYASQSLRLQDSFARYSPDQQAYLRKVVYMAARPLLEMWVTSLLDETEGNIVSLRGTAVVADGILEQWVETGNSPYTVLDSGLRYALEAAWEAGQGKEPLMEQWEEPTAYTLVIFEQVVQKLQDRTGVREAEDDQKIATAMETFLNGMRLEAGELFDARWIKREVAQEERYRSMLLSERADERNDAPPEDPEPHTPQSDSERGKVLQWRAR